ncbi:MAG: ABC-2 type transport system ATP-binding protein [Patiriisocius sp.]|jgi:ABC-2 type transport system ATP-binding protein
MISVKNLSRVFDKHKVVDDLSFEIFPGDIIGFLGPNGAGKSTTMKMLTGFLPASSGSIEINGLRYTKSTREGLQIKRDIGYLPEGAPAYCDMTVYQFLYFITQVRKIPRGERKLAIARVCEQVQLEQVLNKTIDNLSKGFKRRVGIAQAIIHDPQILILDEPTDGLDPNQKHHVRQLIHNLAKDKMVIVSTHILEEVSAVCNRVIIIAQGKKCFDDTPEALKAMSPLHNAVTLKLSYLSDISGLLELEGVCDMKHDRVTNKVTIYAESGKYILGQVTAHIQAHQMPVDMIFPEQVKLDDVFREITTGNGQEAQA